MLSPLSLRQNAWGQIKAAQALRDQKLWGLAVNTAGYAVELMLKARICVDCNWPGYPETKAEFAGKLDKKTHALDTLLGFTTCELRIKQFHMNAWSVCLQWNPESRYQPMYSANENSAVGLLSAAEEIIREISANPGLEAVTVAANDNPYFKLYGVHEELLIERGEFYLYGVFHRQDSCVWSSELVVSAPWIDAQTRDGIQHVIAMLGKMLTPRELKPISGIIAFDVTHPFIQEVTKTVGVKNGVNCWFGFMTPGGVVVEKAMIVSSQRVVNTSTEPRDRVK